MVVPKSAIHFIEEGEDIFAKTRKRYQKYNDKKETNIKETE